MGILGQIRAVACSVSRPVMFANQSFATSLSCFVADDERCVDSHEVAAVAWSATYLTTDETGSTEALTSTSRAQCLSPLNTAMPDEFFSGCHARSTPMKVASFTLTIVADSTARTRVNRLSPEADPLSRACLLSLQQLSFPLDPPAVSGKVAIAAHDPMTGHCQRNRV